MEEPPRRTQGFQPALQVQFQLQSSSGERSAHTLTASLSFKRWFDYHLKTETKRAFPWGMPVLGMKSASEGRGLPCLFPTLWCWPLFKIPIGFLWSVSQRWHFLQLQVVPRHLPPIPPNPVVTAVTSTGSRRRPSHQSVLEAGCATAPTRPSLTRSDCASGHASSGAQRTCPSCIPEIPREHPGTSLCP